MLKPPLILLFSGIITSILRFVEFFRNDLFADYTYDGSDSLIWTIIEPGVYFIAAALLTMRPLFRWVFKDVKMPSYMLKLTSWKGSSKSTLGAIHKEERIELEYSNSGTPLQAPEPARIKSPSGRNGFQRLEEGSLEDGGSGSMGTVLAISQEDPWLTTALR